MASKIAEAYVELKAKGAEKIKSALRGVNRGLKDTDNNAKKAGVSVSKIGAAGEKLQATLGKLLIPVAAVTALLGVLNTLTQARREAEKFQKSLRDISTESARAAADLARASRGGIGSEEQLQRLQDANAELERVQQLADELATAPPALSDYAGLIGLIQSRAEKIAELEAKANTLAQRRNELRRAGDQADAAANAARAEAIRQENEFIQQQINGDETTATRIATSRKILELQKQRTEAIKEGRDAESEAISDQIRLVRELGREDIRRINESKRAAKQAEEDKAREAQRLARENARVASEENARVLREFQQGLIDAATSSQTTGSFGQLEGLLAGIADDLKLLKGRIR